MSVLHQPIIYVPHQQQNQIFTEYHLPLDRQLAQLAAPSSTLSMYCSKGMSFTTISDRITDIDSDPSLHVPRNELTLYLEMMIIQKNASTPRYLIPKIGPKFIVCGFNSDRFTNQE